MSYAVWLILVGAYLVFSTAFSLTSRHFSQKTNLEHSDIIITLSYVFAVWPIGLIYALIAGNIDFSPVNTYWWLLVFSGFLYAVAFFTLFRANRHVSAGQTSILSNLRNVVTIVLLTVLLHESLKTSHMLGAVILLVAVVLSIILTTKKKSQIFKLSEGTLLTIIGFTILGGAVFCERYLLKHFTISTYMIVGWGGQTLAMVAMASKSLFKFKKQLRKFVRPVTWLGLARGLTGITFVVTVAYATNVSTLTAIQAYVTPMIVVASYFLLKEREYLITRLACAFAATVGLLLLVK